MSKSDSDGIVTEISGSGPKFNPAEAGQSPKALRDGYEELPVPDPEDGNGGEAAQGALGSSVGGHSYNDNYRDGGGRYAPPSRNRRR